jgi:SSS family solute:Na+ symporter
MGGAYAHGLVIFNYEWTAAIVLVLVALFVLPVFLRARVFTVPDYLEHRYDARTRRLFSVFTLLAILFIDVAGALYAGGLVVANALGFVSLWQAVAMLALVAGIYTILGGLSAVVVTDTVQSLLLIAGAAVILVLGLERVGGWSALLAATPPEMQRLVLPAGDDFLPWTGLWGVVLLGFYYWGLNQFVVQRMLGAKDLDAGRRGALLAGFLKLPNLALMVVPGLIALQLYPGLATPDLAFPALAFDLMPAGLRGLVLAALMAAIMSSLDSALNAAGTLVAMDLVKPLRPRASPEALVVVGRVVTALAMVFGAVYAPLIARFESLFGYFQSSLSYVVPPIVVVCVLGILVPRLTAAGAFWTMLAGLVVGIPLFLVKEVLGWWSAWGLPAIHYTVMASAIMCGGVALHVVVSWRAGPTTSGRDATMTRTDWHDLRRRGPARRFLLPALLLLAGVAAILWRFA